MTCIQKEDIYMEQFYNGEQLIDTPLIQSMLEKSLGFTEMYLYCDCGQGFTEADKLSAPVKLLSDGKLTVSFTLKQDAHALRFDPGENSCVLSKLACSDSSLSLLPQNGFQTETKQIVFLVSDPVLLLNGRSDFKKGEHIAFSFRYEACNLADIQSQVSGLANRYLALEQTLASGEVLDRASSAELHAELEKAQSRYAEAQKELDKMTFSSSWRITAPLRRLFAPLRRLFALLRRR